jgi:hypothetical protein
MNLFKAYKLSGILSLILGIMAACCLISIQLVPFALLCAILGFISSGINVFLDAKHEFSNGRFPLGYIGMILSSLPVIFLMYIIFSAR